MMRNKIRVKKKREKRHPQFSQRKRARILALIGFELFSCDQTFGLF
jgi:hypothetical protein